MHEQRLAAGWMRELETVAARIGTFVPRRESRDRVGRFLRVTSSATRAATAGSSPTPPLRRCPRACSA